MILVGKDIKDSNIIDPFCDRTNYRGLSFGLGPAGYDVRAEFDRHGSLDLIVIPPGGFALASTIERFTMPDDVMGIVHDKSTWARLGLAVQNTVIEPGWCGYLTLELTNHSKDKITIHKGIGIAQVIFHLCTGSVRPYKGKYQHQQRGPVEAKLLS